MGCHDENKKLQAQGFFPPELWHGTSSSTLREMWGLLHSLEFCLDIIRHKSVQIFTDNSNVVKVMGQGSTDLCLNDIVLRIISFTMEHDISLLPTWVPRDQNKIADGLTHLENPCDWTLNADVFHTVAQWGLPTIDRFASHSNYLLDRFNSMLRCPGSLGINALAQRDWSEHINWCFPPFNLIPSAISIIRHFSAASILVLPLWPSSPWWPLLSTGQHFFPFVHGCRVLPRLENLLTPGPRTASAPRAFKRWTFLAVLCFSAKPPPQPIPTPPMLAGHRCTLESDISKLLFGKCPTPTLKAEHTYNLSCISQPRCQKTLLRYNAHWFRFRSWCQQNKLSFLPADPMHIAMFLSDSLSWSKI